MPALRIRALARFAIVCLLALSSISVAVTPFVSSAARAQSPGGIDACAGSDSATNSVIHFYLALDQRQFADAYECLSPWESGRISLQQLKQSYAHTIAVHLVYADDGVPNGTPATTVRVDVHVVNRVSGAETLVAYHGLWHANAVHQLSNPHLSVEYTSPESSVPPTMPISVFKSYGLTVVRHISADVTGDGIPDDIYVTTEQACTNCRVQYVWIYSLDRLVFQQAVDDVQLIPWKDHLAIQVRTDTPGSKGIDSAAPSERTYVTWFWTPFGFVFHARKTIQVNPA